MNQLNQNASNAQYDQADQFEFEYLGPEYEEERHGAYLEMLSKALEDPRCHNIALSGPYGCGKSSIIEEYRRQNPETTLVISLWSLSPEPQDSVSASEDSSADGNPADTLTNRLEREIVRQILYSGTHDAVPFSRFNRMHPINPNHRLLWAGAISLAAGLGFALYGEDCPLTKLVPSAGPYLGVIRTLFCGVVAFFLVRALYPWAVAGLRSLSLSSGHASASFSLGSGSYFDKYLDEIIYFFEANQYNTVILEDLDRFDDPLIYTELRDLNLVLNNAPGIRSKFFAPTKRSAQPSDAEHEDQAMGVRFVYALRDGIFDGGCSAQIVLAGISSFTQGIRKRARA